jgi:hypothetical protein
MSYMVRSSGDKEHFLKARDHIADHLRTTALMAAFQMTLKTRETPNPVTFCLAIKLARAALYQAAFELATHPVQVAEIHR